MLHSEAGLSIVGQELDADRAVEGVKRLQPEAVVIVEGSQTPQDAAALATRLLAAGAKRVISLSLRDNILQLYPGGQCIVKRVEDLVMAIKDVQPRAAEEVVTAVLARMSAAPSYSLVLYRALRYCEAPRTAGEIEQEMLSYPEMKTSVYPPVILLGWLEECGGVERLVVEKQEDRWRTTEAGRRAAELEAPAKRLRELLDSQPVYREIYTTILRFCKAPRERSEIEELLKGNPVMEKPKTYPTYFIQELEQAGGLEWVGKWQTTEAGEGVTG